MAYLTSTGSDSFMVELQVPGNDSLKSMPCLLESNGVKKFEVGIDLPVNVNKNENLANAKCSEGAE